MGGASINRPLRLNLHYLFEIFVNLNGLTDNCPTLFHSIWLRKLSTPFKSSKKP